MILILCEDAEMGVAHAIREKLEGSYAGRLQIEIISASTESEREIDPAWDDVLLAIYRDASFTGPGKQFLESYRRATDGAGLILPVALDADQQSPPAPYSGIKAIPFDDRALDRIDRRIGAMLGLKLRSRDTQVFISYRSVDGAALARQLEAFLKSRGYQPWLDEARDDFDNESNILGGEDVQGVLERNLEKADLVLLLDTPKAPESGWIKLEVESATSCLIPVLPIVCRAEGDQRRGSRFRILLELRRFVEVDLPPEASGLLTNAELKAVVSEMETFLCEIFQRKLRLPSIAAKTFQSHQWDWIDQDPPRLLFLSNRRKTPVPAAALCHCSIFDEVHLPSLRRFIAVSQKGPDHNYRLFIYDGDPLSMVEIVELQKEAGPAASALLVHHQQLGTLLESNFTRM